jgi:hypothetical protein
MRAARSFLIVPCLLVLGLAGVGAQANPTAAPSLDPDCVRFDDPSAVVDGEIVFAGFTAYRSGLDHAVGAWSPARGFSVPMREVVPEGAAVPPEANLIYRDASIPGAAFKGVTVTWSQAPATITLNLAALPPPETADRHGRETILAVLTHETGHALGLGDVPQPGVAIRECANMLMKRSVDKGGGAFTEPQPGDIALYCMRWGGTVCGDRPRPANAPIPAPPVLPERQPTAASASAPGRSTTTYRYFVVTCEQLPVGAVTPERVEAGDLPDEPPYECSRAPVGMLFRVLRDGGTGEAVLTDGNGEFAFQKADGVGVEVGVPQGGETTFPSLVGYRPAELVHRIPADDPDCPPEAPRVCNRVYVLVPSSS